MRSARGATIRGVIEYGRTRKDPNRYAAQPYRRAGGRQPGLALDNMLRGAPVFMSNPANPPKRMTRRRRRQRDLVDWLLQG